MANTVSANGWLVKDGQVIVSPVTSFQVNAGLGTACALQFTFWEDAQAEAKRETSVIQLAMTLDAVVALRQMLEKAETTLKAHR
jgi:hypothetical protein